MVGYQDRALIESARLVNPRPGEAPGGVLDRNVAQLGEALAAVANAWLFLIKVTS